MKLTILSESDAYNRGLKLLGDNPKASKIIDVLIQCDPTKNKKYLPWLIKQYKLNHVQINNINKPSDPQLRLPEDTSKLVKAFNLLEKHRTGLNVYDYDWYTLDDKLDEFRVNGGLTSTSIYPGVETIKVKGPYTLLKVPQLNGDDDELKISALQKLGLGTKWCTREDFPNPQAENYLKKSDVYVVLKDGKPYLQFDYASDQAMNIKDQSDLKALYNIFPELMLHPNWSYNCALKVIEGRWLEAEPIILTNPTVSYKYARDIIGGRWSEAEPIIMKNPYLAYQYASIIIGGRWPEAEPTIMENPECAYHYAHEFIGDRWSEAESTIKKDPRSAYLYARDIIKDRWFEAEPTIKKDPQWAYDYTEHVVRDRWPEAEPIISKNPEWAYMYALHIIKDRWPEAEPTIMKNPKWIYLYAFNVIGSRWPEAEPYLARDPYWFETYTNKVVNHN